jgi:hypothetical protein
LTEFIRQNFGLNYLLLDVNKLIKKETVSKESKIDVFVNDCLKNLQKQLNQSVRKSSFISGLSEDSFINSLISSLSTTLQQFIEKQ